MLNNLSSTWDLDVFFAGGSESTAFANYILKLENQLQIFSNQLNNSDTESRILSTWKDILRELQDIIVKTEHANSFVRCLEHQNKYDKKAVELRGKVNSLQAIKSSIENNIEEKLLRLTDERFKKLVKNNCFKDIKFNLSEIRNTANKKLSANTENIISDLAVDGLHSWETLYRNIFGNIKIPVNFNSEVKELSVGQAYSIMKNSANRDDRKKVFNSWNSAWDKVADSCAFAINSIAGYRLNVYKHRGWNDFRYEALENNRITRKTLDTMWATVSKNKDLLVKYLNRKKELLGITKLNWYDYRIPLNMSKRDYSYQESANLITEHVSNFSPVMGEFVTKAFKERWVESEKRNNKRAGAYCTSFSLAKQTRVYTTYENKWNTITLAHELGHAYHQHIRFDLPPLARRSFGSLNETASTFFELLMTDALLKAAPTKEEKIDILNFDLQRSVWKLMNTHARYIFETNFYEQRKSHFVNANELNEIMLSAQKEAYKDSLNEYQPRFWSSLQHFYMTKVPFYNFPYTFGFLFSSGIYALSKVQGKEFEKNYVSLLCDTGRMRTEDLARKYLGVDLEKEKFWQEAINIALAGYDEFMKLTKEN